VYPSFEGEEKRREEEKARRYAHTLDYTVNRETEKEGSRRDSLYEDDEGGRGEYGGWREGGGALLSPSRFPSRGPMTRPPLPSPPLQRRESPAASRLPPPAVTAGVLRRTEGYARHACLLVLSHSLQQADRVHVLRRCASCRSRSQPRSYRSSYLQHTLDVSRSDAYQIDSYARDNVACSSENRIDVCEPVFLSRSMLKRDRAVYLV